ncbi:MAG: hypothetical protein F4Z40_00880 [Chloroflexi bacterium]|nr:hypothetical protein [Chloroflexota bacterium]
MDENARQAVEECALLLFAAREKLTRIHEYLAIAEIRADGEVIKEKLPVGFAADHLRSALVDLGLVLTGAPPGQEIAMLNSYLSGMFESIAEEPDEHLYD